MPTKSKELMVYEALDRDLEAAQSFVMDLYTQQRDGEALRAAAAMKEFVVKAKYKQAPGMTTIELPADQVAALGGPAAVVRCVAQAAMSLADQVMTDAGKSSGAGTLTSDEKPTSTEAVKKASLAKLYDEAIKGYRR